MADNVSQECKAEVAQRQASAMQDMTKEQQKLSTIAKLFASSDPNSRAFAGLKVDMAVGASLCKEEEIPSRAAFTAVANSVKDAGKGR